MCGRLGWSEPSRSAGGVQAGDRPDGDGSDEAADGRFLRMITASLGTGTRRWR